MVSLSDSLATGPPNAARVRYWVSRDDAARFVCSGFVRLHCGLLSQATQSLEQKASSWGPHVFAILSSKFGGNHLDICLLLD